MTNYIRPILKLIVFIICLIICAIPVGFFQQIPLINGLQDQYATVVIESLLIISIFGALWMISRLYKPSTFDNFFLRTEGMLSGILKGGLFGIGCIAVCVTLIALTGSVSLSAGKISLVFFLYYILYFLVIAVFEELLFRTYLLFVFAETYPIWLAVVINGLLFGLVHATNPGFTWLGMVNISLAGILFSLFTIQYKSISWAIGIHLGWNFAQGILFGYKVSGTDTPGLLIAQPTGIYYLSGGTFGVEGSVICTLVLTAIIIYISRNYNIKSSRNILTEENEFTGTR
jgi:membrane protease YdiL (CAAX protease family)